MSASLANQVVRIVLLVVLCFLVKDFWRATNGHAVNRFRNYFAIMALNMVVVIAGSFESTYDFFGPFDLNAVIREHVYVLNGLHLYVALRLWESLQGGGPK